MRGCLPGGRAVAGWISAVAGLLLRTGGAVSKARKIEPRVCHVCLRDFGVDGPLTWEADLHRVGGELVLTCSPECRRAMGVGERKQRFEEVRA